MKKSVIQHRIPALRTASTQRRSPTWYQRSVFVLQTAICGMLASSAALAEDHPGTAEYIDKIVAEHQLDRAFVEQIIQQAEYRQDIIDLMTRPAEGKPWHEYRKIFLNDRRIKSGAVYMTGNQELLNDIEQRFGVPAEIVTAITGIETSYGGNTGRHRVIDALVTLGFYYPKRAEFFSSELTNLLRLSKEESLPLLELRGSYAGAMGLGQFMPSSYRAYAVDFDQDGRRDLWQSLEDALASVANYLHEHRWQTGQPVVLPATVVDESKLPKKPKLKLDYTLGELAELGVTPLYGDLPPDTKAMLVKLEREDGYEYWIGLNNFYAITRYNRSPLYAMAVFQLSQAIVDATPAGQQAKPSAQHSAGEAK